MQFKHNISYLIGMLSILAVSLCSCSDDEELLINSPSYRDGVYSGTQLTVTLDGEEVETVKSVTLSSTLLDANISQDKKPDQIVNPSDPTYTTVVKIVGFPSSNETCSFTTVSNLEGFYGTASIQGSEYNYEAVFTGNPLLHHDNQGLILRFTK